MRTPIRPLVTLIGALALMLTACGADDGADRPPTGSGTATITFDDGETLSTDVRCALEPQDAVGGGQILYTATSGNAPYFDLTVFGEDGEMTDISISWDESLDDSGESWSAGRVGSDAEVSLDGATMTGSATFMQDGGGQGRRGQVEVDCSG